MAKTPGRVALITGANSGIGYELARQLAAAGRHRLLILGCRSRDKADRAVRSLERESGATAFGVMQVDLSDAADVRRAARGLATDIDDLVMNAGGSGGPKPLSLTKDGVTNIFASNVLGHAVLLDELLRANRLRGTAIYVGSEAARGAPSLGMPRPTLARYSVDEFSAICDGSFFAGRPADPRLAYGQVKLVAALWMSGLAQNTPGLRLLTVSPGNTSGTALARDFPLPLRLFLSYVFMPLVAPRLGLAHDVRRGAARLVQALEDPSFRSGGFYASEQKAVIGPLAEQSAFFPEFGNGEIQANALAAVQHFVDATQSGV